MGKTTTSRVTLVTSTEWVVRRRRKMVQVGCPDCGRPVGLLASGKAESLRRTILNAISGWVENESICPAEIGDGHMLICLHSLADPANCWPTGEIKLPAEERCEADEGEGRDHPMDEEELALQRRWAMPGLYTWREEMINCSPSRKQDWNLSQGSFDKLLQCLDDERDRAGQEYISIRRKLMKFFECRGCPYPVDLSDLTIDRVARKVYSGEVVLSGEISNYFYGVARNVLREYRNGKDRKVVSLESLQEPELPSITPEILSKQRCERDTQELYLQAMEACMEKLSAENRAMLIEYYQGAQQQRIQNRKNMALRRGVTQNALKIRIHRIRESLHFFMRESLGEVPRQRAARKRRVRLPVS